jgi:exopolyphosphatase/guanosine-5'-triphosphate,3'-diphosphate pyrophosphatase
MRVAAIDVGTNTVRLLVVDGDDVVERVQRITRLGKGVDSSGKLQSDSMSRTLEAVVSYVGRARELGAERIRIAGTSALRDAANRDEFASGVREATGLELEILDGRTEGRCAYVGATSWVGPGSYVVCDIGGGSTELITAADEVSVDVGSVRVRERFFASDPPMGAEIDAARNFVSDAITGGARSITLTGDEALVGVAGTITTLAALVLGLQTYESARVHGSRLTRSDVNEWSRRLLALPAEEIRRLGPVEPGRADIIGAGSLILSVVMDVLGYDELLVSERDILDGLAAERVG